MRDDALAVVACGSIAVTGLPGYLMLLNHQVDLGLRVLLTHGAERFLPRPTVAWYADEVFASQDQDLNPIEFAMRSIGTVVLLATANMLAAAALGLAGTPAQTAVLASPRPCLFFPSMNESMWGAASTQRHVATLRGDGHTVVEPLDQEVYVLWQRTFAPGRVMPPPDSAVETIIGWLDDGLATTALQAM